MKFVELQPLSDPEVAMHRLLKVANGVEADHAGRLQVATVNSQFLAYGGLPDVGRVFDVHAGRS